MKKYVMMVSLGAVLIMNMFAQEREEPQLEKWAVASLDGKELPAQWIYICIDPVTNTLFGKSACNSFNGAISLNQKKQTFTTGNFITTMMMCDEEKMKWEEQFLQLLSNQKKLKYVYENRMIRVLSKKKEIMVLQKYNEEAPVGSGSPSYAQFMQENTWKLIQIEGENYMSDDVYLTFDTSNNKVAGKSACNRYLGSYTIKGEMIEMGMLGSTKMACDEEKKAVEYHYLGILSDNTFRYDVADQVLNFYKDDKIVLMFGLSK